MSVVDFKAYVSSSIVPVEAATSAWNIGIASIPRIRAEATAHVVRARSADKCVVEIVAVDPGQRRDDGIVVVRFAAIHTAVIPGCVRLRTLPGTQHKVTIAKCFVPLAHQLLDPQSCAHVSVSSTMTDDLAPVCVSHARLPGGG